MQNQKSSVLEAEKKTLNGFHFSGEDAVAEFVPEAEYWENYYSGHDRSYEWNNGQLEVVPMADYAKYLMYLWFVDVLRDFLHVNPLGKIVGLEIGFRLALATKTTIRKPDLGLVLNSNNIPLLEHDRSYHGIFDLCVESLSDSNQSEIDRDTIIKRNEYAAAGVQEYYILDERGIDTQFYHLTHHRVYEPITPVNGIIHSRVLPGFQFRVSDLYSKPSPPQMVNDPVYSAYISPFYRNERLLREQAEQLTERERQRADQERQRAEKERQRAEKERLRAEEYAALLKAAGLLPKSE